MAAVWIESIEQLLLSWQSTLAESKCMSWAPDFRSVKRGRFFCGALRVTLPGSFLFPYVNTVWWVCGGLCRNGNGVVEVELAGLPWLPAMGAVNCLGACVSHWWPQDVLDTHLPNSAMPFKAPSGQILALLLKQFSQYDLCHLWSPSLNISPTYSPICSFLLE